MPESSRQPQRQASALPVIKGFLETSFLDWKGLISSVVFLPGCNFRCPYCHNFQLVSEPEGLMSFEPRDVFDRLRPFVGWIDGVVVSGGEPTLHPGLAELMGRFKEMGFKVKLDTNGSRPGVVEKLWRAGLVDMVALDIKAPLEPLAYRRATGVNADLDAVRSTLELLKSCGVDFEIRSTIWPQWHGAKELVEMASQIGKVPRWTLQALNPQSAWDQQPFEGGEPYTPQELERLQTSLADPVLMA